MVQASVTVEVSGYNEYTEPINIAWFDNVSLGSTFDAGGEEQTLHTIRLWAESVSDNSFLAGDVAFSIVGTNNRFTNDFESNGRITFTASDGETLELVGFGGDMSEPYTWSPSNSAEVISFVSHVMGLTNHDITLTLTGEATTVIPPERGLYTLTPVITNPDLQIDSLVTNDASLTPGQSFTLTAIVRNHGNANSPAAVLRWRKSSNSDISTFDTQVGTDSIPVLAPNATSTQTITLLAPSTLGTHYYGATVDSVAGESDTNNNASTAAVVTVAPALTIPHFSDDTGDAQMWTHGQAIANITVPAATGNPAPTYSVISGLPTGINFNTSTRVISGTPTTTGSGTIRVRATNSQGSDDWMVGFTIAAAPTPDLTVDTPIRNPSGNLTPGQNFTLSTTVRNAGTGTSGSTTLRWRQSTNSNITTSDPQVGTDSVSSLLAGASGNESISLAAPSIPGTYYYGATVDSVPNESNTGNNASGAIAVTVVAALTIPSFADDTGNAQNWTVGTTIPSITVPTASGNPTPTYAAVGNLPSGINFNTINRVISGTPTVSGSGTIRVRATNSEGSDDWTVGYTIAAAPTPDLTVDTPTKSPSGNLSPGQTFTLSTTVRNGGTGSSPSTTLRWRRSTDANITTSDTQVGTDFVSAISAGASGNESINLSAPSTPGTYYYGATVDSVANESNTGNNASGSLIVTVVALPPDLTVDTPVRSPSGNVTPGQNFTLSTAVRNGGTGPSDSTTLRWRQSTNSNITTGDPQVGTDAVSALSSNGASNESITLVAPSTPGTYYYGATVDSVPNESNTGNNASGAVSLTVIASLVIPHFSDDTGDAQSWIQNQAIANITVPAASGNPTPTYAAVSGLPSGVTFNTVTRVISGTPTGTGSGTIRIRATNSEGSDDWTIAYTTSAPAAERGLYTLAPTLTVPTFADSTGDAQSWTTGLAINPITVPAASGNPTPTYAVVGALPSGINFNTITRVISGTPTAVGSSTIRIRATNSEGSADWTVAYVTSAALSIPSFADSTGNAQSWTVGSAIANITVPLASGNPVPTYSLISGAPAGINFNTVTRVISGTPTGTGSGTIRIRATNSEGSADWTIAYSTSTTAPAEVARMLITVEDDANKWYSIFAGEDLGSFVGRCYCQ